MCFLFVCLVCFWVFFIVLNSKLSVFSIWMWSNKLLNCVTCDFSVEKNQERLHDLVTEKAFTVSTIKFFGLSLACLNWCVRCSFKDHPGGKPMWWETTLVEGHNDERPPRWKTRMMTDHPSGSILTEWWGMPSLKTKNIWNKNDC